MDNTEIDWQITNIILGLTFPTMNGIIPRRIVILISVKSIVFKDITFKHSDKSGGNANNV